MPELLAPAPAGLTANGAPDGPTLSTPALVVDLDVFDANVAAMAALLDGSGKVLRPHVKTHRTPALALRQLGGAAVGVTCATVGEAEAMVAAGIGDVLVANEVVEASKIERLVALAREGSVTVAADAVEPLTALSRSAVAAGVVVGVLVDVDVLIGRCGVDSVAEAVALADLADLSPGLRLVGIMGYEGRLRLADADREGRIRRAYGLLAEVRAAIIDAGHPVATVSAAGTSTLREALADPTITEIQAGVYALMEPELLVMDLPFRCATTVVATVISRHADRVVLDAGRRVIGVEYGPPIPVGLTAGSVRVNDEHTVLTAPDPLPELGSRVHLVPGQVRTTFNLHDHVWVSRGGREVDRWPVTARGRSS